MLAPTLGTLNHMVNDTAICCLLKLVFTPFLNLKKQKSRAVIMYKLYDACTTALPEPILSCEKETGDNKWCRICSPIVLHHGVTTPIGEGGGGGLK